MKPEVEFGILKIIETSPQNYCVHYGETSKTAKMGFGTPKVICFSCHKEEENEIRKEAEKAIRRKEGPNATIVQPIVLP